MEVDHHQLKSAATDEDQTTTEMMLMMMMQVHKSPEFYGTCNNNNNNNNDVAEFPPTDHTTHHNNIASIPHFINTHNNPPHNNNIASPSSFINVPSHHMSLFNGNSSSSSPVEAATSMQTYLSYSSNNPFNNSSQQKRNSMAAMRETIFRIAAMQPVHIDPESVKPPKRRNVKISKDPQSVAARHRRERISERIRILQRLVPGGTKMDTASMLDEAIHYVKFLKTQVQSLERAAGNNRITGIGFPATTVITTGNYLPIGKEAYEPVENGPDYGDA